MGLTEDGLRIKNALKKFIKDVVNEETKSCFRLYQAKVIAVPNGQTCEVQLVGDNATMNLPYSSKIANITSGSYVWVATVYNSFSNAIVWETIDFK